MKDYSIYRHKESMGGGIGRHDRRNAMVVKAMQGDYANPCPML